MAAIIARPADGTESTGWSDLSTVGKARLGAFYVLTAGTLGLALFMTRAELELAFTGWFENLGSHQVHDMTIFPMLWLAYLVPIALLLYRPARRVNAAIAPLVFLAPLVVFAALASSPILLLPALFGVLALLVAMFHPAGRDLLRFDRVETVSRVLAGLLVVAAVPLLVYAGDQAVRQLTVADEHALFAHYGAMAIAGLYVAVMGTLAVVRQRDWRFAAWGAGLVAATVGTASVAFAVESSLGTVGGGLLVAWAVAFVAAVEYERRRGRDRDERAGDEHATAAE